METQLSEISGAPFSGNMLDKLIAFLKQLELTYDPQITYSVVFMQGDIIAATGSIQGNVLKCIGIHPDFRGCNLLSLVMTHLISKLMDSGITHYFGFTKPKNRDVFGNMGLYPVAETSNILLLENRRNGLKKYVELLQEETTQAMRVGQENKSGDQIGAIIANCNPFSKGHRYLIETAANQCQWLHLFVLSSDSSMFSAEDRYQMVALGVKDLKNVILHRTSDYLISPIVFPTYFLKEKQHALEMNCKLDITIFGKHIASALKIQKRYVGEEPFCKVTHTYNACLKQELPAYGIDCIEIPRCAVDGNVISATKVREAICSGAYDQAEIMLPSTTIAYLKEMEQWKK